MGQPDVLIGRDDERAKAGRNVTCMETFIEIASYQESATPETIKEAVQKAMDLINKRITDCINEISANWHIVYSGSNSHRINASGGSVFIATLTVVYNKRSE